MDASPASPTTSSHKRLSLVLRFGPHVNADIPSEIAVETKRKMPSIGDTDNSPPADTEPPRQASPTVHNQRNPFPSSPTLSSFLGLKTTPSASDIPASPKETRSRLVKLKKARGLSIVSSPMNTPDSGSSELEIEDTNLPSEFADIKELPDPQSTSSTSLHTQCTSISSPGQLQRVKDIVLSRTALPALSTNKSKMPHHETGGSISNTSSVQRNSLSGPSPSHRIPMDFGEPSTTPISSLAAGPGQSIALDSLPKATPLPSPTLSDTAGTSRKAIAQQRRRMSFDFASLKQPRLSPIFLNPMQMQRSQSLFRQQKGSADSEPTKSADIKDDLHEPMSERQRALNVKRARKMAQVFGTEPPASLYQITTRNDEEEDDGLVTPVEERMVDSLANIFSSSHLPTPSAHSRLSSTSSAVIADSHQDCRGCGAPEQKPGRPQTPPPFTPQAQYEPLQSESPTPSFKARRRRAAKLTHFFGVGYHHLSESMGLPVATSTSSLNEVAELGPNISITHPIPSSSVQVDVKVSGPARFWGIVDGRRDMKEASMNDVIGKLREMKAK